MSKYMPMVQNDCTVMPMVQNDCTVIVLLSAMISTDTAQFHTAW